MYTPYRAHSGTGEPIKHNNIEKQWITCSFDAIGLLGWFTESLTAILYFLNASSFFSCSCFCIIRISSSYRRDAAAISSRAWCSSCSYRDSASSFWAMRACQTMHLACNVIAVVTYGSLRRFRRNKPWGKVRETVQKQTGGCDYILNYREASRFKCNFFTSVF